jgi:hypothetical protein
LAEQRALKVSKVSFSGVSELVAPVISRKGRSKWAEKTRIDVATSDERVSRKEKGRTGRVNIQGEGKGGNIINTAFFFLKYIPAYHIAS